mmetsp:Transcript_41389/g.119089  ORF Transcript_41389/g.119089 Transcript_41389/m.119089 type:complete len:246 (+) Transcript_41389:274-1011(+)
MAFRQAAGNHAVAVRVPLVNNPAQLDLEPANLADQLGDSRLRPHLHGLHLAAWAQDTSDASRRFYLGHLVADRDEIQAGAPTAVGDEPPKRRLLPHEGVSRELVLEEVPRGDAPDLVQRREQSGDMARRRLLDPILSPIGYHHDLAIAHRLLQKRLHGLPQLCEVLGLLLGGATHEFHRGAAQQSVIPIKDDDALHLGPGAAGKRGVAIFLEHAAALDHGVHLQLVLLVSSLARDLVAFEAGRCG